LKLALADYDAALATMPKNAWSLYGRGVAWKRSGDEAKAAKDRAAATAIDPDVTKRALRYGLAE
jgi:hypothetical protein